MAVQAPVLSFSFPALPALSLSIYLTGPNTLRTLPLSCTPLPALDWAMQQPKEARSRLRSTTLSDWNTLTGAILPPCAEPLPITDYDGEATPDQSERPGLFEVVS